MRLTNVFKWQLLTRPFIMHTIRLAQALPATVSEVNYAGILAG
jgi:hypothetical protein